MATASLIGTAVVAGYREVMGSPQTALEALGWRRLLVSGWPWRSAGYLIATVPVAIVAAALVAVPAVPWLVLAAGGYPAGAVVLLVLLGAALIAAAGPLIAVPVASLARRRASLAGLRQPGSLAGHREPGGGGAELWLRARYADPAAWRQAGYVFLLATVVPVLSVTALLAAPLAVVFIASPFLVLAQQPGSSPVALFGHLATVPQALPYVAAGLVLLPASGYLVTLVAGADAAVARSLLAAATDEQLRAELTEVTASRARLTGAFEAERRRIERDLHDGAPNA